MGLRVPSARVGGESGGAPRGAQAPGRAVSPVRERKAAESHSVKPPDASEFGRTRRRARSRERGRAGPRRTVPKTAAGARVQATMVRREKQVREFGKMDP